MKRILALAALTILTACDRVAGDFRGERDDRLYKAAMDDYRAGRMDAAFAGFEKSVCGNPANASARFQLACLQHDLKKDFISAYCGYREFLLQHPESDRARIARERLSVCEKELARTLADKYGLNESAGMARELDAVRAELKAMKDRVAAAEKNLGVSQERVRSLSDERDRLLAAVKGLGREAQAPSAIQDVLREKVALEREEEPGVGGIQAINRERELLEREAEDENSTGPSLIPVRRPGELVRRESEPTGKGKDGKPAPRHPKTYVVEEGDTLYGIAKRFYGSIQPWKAIRDANKAVISSDNRLKAGDTIVLP